MAGIARNIELYQLAYRLAWPYVSEFQKSAVPNIALQLHDSIRRQLNQGLVEPVLIASEALKGIDKLNGQIDDNETSPTRAAGRNSRLRRALNSVPKYALMIYTEAKDGEKTKDQNKACDGSREKQT